MHTDNAGYFHINVKVDCPDAAYSRTCLVPISYKPVDDKLNYVYTAGCDFATGSQKCAMCREKLLKIFTTKRDYDETETIFMYDIKRRN